MLDCIALNLKLKLAGGYLVRLNGLTKTLL